MKRFLSAIALVMVFFTAMVAGAQGIITGSLGGSVQDSTGAVIKGATVTAHNDQTGFEAKTQSSASGAYAFSALPVGTYTLKIDSAGFAESTVKGLTVRSGVTSSAGPATLSINASESVDVTSAAAALETTQAQVTATFEAQQVQDLPTGGRLDALTLLIPGVVRTLSDNFSNSNGVNFSSNGLRGRSNNFEIDGQSNNDNSIGGPQFFFHNEDAVGQYEVITNNFSAQYGRNAGSVVNYVTKSGTNSFHGTAFENYFGSWGSSLLPSQKDPLFGFCAPGQTTGCTTPVVPRVTANEFGGSIGGPILKDKLFFFGGYLERLITNGASPSISTTLTPTPNGLKQLAAAFPNNPFVTSLTNQGPYSVTLGNPTPVSSTVSNVTVCATASATCPTGTTTTAEFAAIQRFLPSTAQDYELVSRLDYQLTPKDHVYLRYMYQNAPTKVSGGTVSTGSYYDVTDKVHSIGSDITHTFNSNIVNQLRYDFQQSVLVFGGGGYPTCVDASISKCASNVAITGYAGYGPATNIPQGRVVKVTQVQDNASWLAGNHSINFGGEWDYQNSPNTFLPNTSGAFSFAGFNYGLAGSGTLGLANGSPNIPFREPDIALYVQDDWKFSDSLTFNLGLRWEYFKQGINVLNQISTANQNGPKPIWATSLPQNLTTFPYIPEKYKNFEPRLGFAWNPHMDRGLVVRGGFAISYDPAFYNIFLNSYTSAPVVNTGIITCDGVSVQCLPTGGTINALVHTQDDPYNPSGVNPGTKVQGQVASNFSNPYTETYTLGVQHTIGSHLVGEVRYVGNHAVKQFQSVNANPAVNLAPPTSVLTVGKGYAASPYQTLAQAFPGSVPVAYCSTSGAVGIGHLDCNRTYVYSRNNSAFSIYNGVQMQLNMREWHNVSGVATYTYSRTIDNASEIFSTGSGGNTLAYAQNPFDTNVGERGVSGNSYPNVASFGLTYKLPFYKEERGLIGRLLGGYELSGIYTYNSGQPYTPEQSTKAAPNSAALAVITCGQQLVGGSCPVPQLQQGVNVNQALFSFGDYYFNSGVAGADTSRPILANPNGKPGSVTINGGPGVGYIDFATGQPVSRSTNKWLINNQFEALAMGNPFPGVGRNTLRGQSVNEFDLSVFKEVRITSRISTRLSMTAYNLPNRLYLGTPDVLINDANPAVHGAKNYASFENYLANGGTIVGTPFGKGNRNIQLGAKIIF